jgi:hypothetical protein
MVQAGRRSVSMHRMALTVLTLALSGACRADAPSPDGTVKPESANAEIPRSRIHGPPTHRTVDQGINESVRRLTRGLDLDPAQQAKLREILLDQHRQIVKLRKESPEPGTDQTGLNLAILDRTKARIRAMLSEEQKKKYSADVPRDTTGPAQADLQHWMDIQESKRRNGEDDSN